MVVYETIPFKVMDSGTYALARTLAYQLVNVYALRMASIHVLDLHAHDPHRDLSLSIFSYNRDSGRLPLTQEHLQHIRRFHFYSAHAKYVLMKRHERIG